MAGREAAVGESERADERVTGSMSSSAHLPGRRSGQLLEVQILELDLHRRTDMDLQRQNA
jgi:hypothetical protein